MTRSEEIQRKAGSIADGMKQHYAPQTECKGYYEGFIEGAKWADRTMLARICEWLENHDMTEHIGVIYSGACSINFDNQGLIDVLCKAMEE